jgi:phosphonate transport system permease protein
MRAAPAEIAAWQARLPAVFPGFSPRRALLWLGFLAWLAGTLWWFDVSPARLWNGLRGWA